MKSVITADFLIVGGGIVGLSIARSLRRRHPNASITLIEKESRPGYHASGRNSGVLHAGFYYTADSLKARFCREGNRQLRKYILEKGIPLNECGKLVVARNSSELPQLDELLRRARANQVPLEEITEEEARQIEPRARTVQKALFSPSTATADPAVVIRAMAEDAAKDGVRICYDTPFVSARQGAIVTPTQSFSAGHVINAAGLHADRIARSFGFSQNHRIIPFKGLYLYSNEPPGAFKTNIYPVPNLKNPFLGVHFTLLADRTVKIGPTAIPAFWREQYDGMSRFSWNELVEIAWRNLGLFVSAGFDFRRLAWEEIRKQSRRHMVHLASQLAGGIDPSQFTTWGEPGIRAQLVHLKRRQLEMDFMIEGDNRSTHILNAVSPAWTCSLPFAEFVCDQLDGAQLPVTKEASQDHPGSLTKH